MTVLVREFEEADREALRQVHVLSRRATFTWQPPEAHQASDFDECTQGERILVAHRDGQPVGFAAIWEAEDFLHSLFVHPAFLRQGVGKALLDRCADHFRGTATLKCVKANVNAQHFYLSQGWTVWREEADPDGVYLLMAKSFDGQALAP